MKSQMLSCRRLTRLQIKCFNKNNINHSAKFYLYCIFTHVTHLRQILLQDMIEMLARYLDTHITSALHGVAHPLKHIIYVYRTHPTA